jgi:hypothetical protein
MPYALFLLLSAQEDVNLGRSGIDAYKKWVPECDRATSQIDSNPKAAIEVFDQILTNDKIEKRECRVRWDISPGTPSKWYDFFPYQYRGRARMKQAESSDRDRAKPLLEGAVKDFEESIRITTKAGKKLKSSEDYLKQAKEALAKLGSDTTDPGEAVRKFEAEWRKLIDAGSFSEAKRFVEMRGEVLNDAQRRAYQDDTNEKCRLALTDAGRRFLRGMRSVGNAKDLEEMAQGTFDRDFAVPDRGTLVEGGMVPQYAWCVEARQAFADLRAKKDILEPLFRLAIRAVPLVRFDFDWFACTEKLAFDLVRSRISLRSEEARTAGSERVKALVQESEKLVERWRKFESDARKEARGDGEFLSRFTERDFAPILARFPINAEGLSEVPGLIRQAAESDDPERALSDVSQRLDRFRSDWNRLTAEARRELVTLQIAIGSLRGFLAGQTLEAVAASLEHLGSDYRGSGGTGDEKRFGSKVGSVFRKLGR